jgi:hypothetical protein
MRISRSEKVIVDTNIPIDVLRRIADYNQVAVMLSPQSTSVEHFFDRHDQEKTFLKEQIMNSPDPDKTMANFLGGVAAINSPEYYNHLASSEFFTVVRADAARDTREETLSVLSKHFGLTDDDHCPRQFIRQADAD